MQNQNSKDKKINIEARLLISLQKLAEGIREKGEKCPDIVRLLHEISDEINRGVREIIKNFIAQQNLKAEVKELAFEYADSDNITHGIAYFKVKLKGTKDELKEIAGGYEKLFLYDWEKTN